MTSRSAKTLERLAFVLDDLVRIPGTNIRVGLDALIGLVPAGGDVATGLVSTYTLVTAHRLGAPPPVLLRIAGNIVVDTVVGAIPLLGDIFDVGFRANDRNVALLRRYLDTPAPVARNSAVVVALLIVALIALALGAAALSILLARWIFSLF